MVKQRFLHRLPGTDPPDLLVFPAPAAGANAARAQRLPARNLPEALSATHRGLLDFLSPTLFATTLAFFAGAIWFDLWAHNYEFTWGHGTMERAVVLTLTNLFLVAVGAFTLLTRTRDPYQSAADRVRKVSASLTSLLFCSIALSVFFVTAAADDIFDIDYLDAIVMSVYFQAVVWISLGYMIRSIRIADSDIEVYRNDVAVT